MPGPHREIVLGLEQPGWRMAGPFPLPQARIEAEGWETTYSDRATILGTGVRLDLLCSF
jgi:hypothetical protein